MAPRSKKAEKKNSSEIVTQSFENNRFLILPDILTNDQNSDRQFIKLRHPQNGDLVIFVYSENDKKLAQMRSLPFSHRSFFNDNEVIPIDRIDFVTLVDPLFLILPYFIKSSSMYSPLDQILTDEDFPKLNDLLMKISELIDLQLIANTKEIGDLVLWQYSDSKALKWLTIKVEKVEKVLVKQQINVNPNAAISSSFKIIDTNGQTSEDHYKRYAFSIVSEYLPVDVQKSLIKHLGLPENVENNKRKANVNYTDVNKKIKHNHVEHDEILYKNEKIVTPKLTAKDKALKKAASGTKNISSFFKKA